MKSISGLHHITALTSDAQKNLDFYAGVLGLRFVKRTVNYDAPDVYHLYYGDETGAPGTVLTFFPFPNMKRGKKGIGQATVISFSVPVNALDYWMKRLKRFGIIFTSPKERFNETYIYFEDFDGLGLEITAVENDGRPGFIHGFIPEEFAIRGFHSIALNEDNYNDTASFMIEQMNQSLVTEDQNRFRFSAGEDAGFVDIIFSPGDNYGIVGSGSVHHVAFATENDESQHRFRENLLLHGTVSPTDVIDRQYFKSVYFREPGGVLFEAATVIPGFTIDEPVEHLGEGLKLPTWEEKNRSWIERRLPEVSLDVRKYKDAQVQYR